MILSKVILEIWSTVIALKRIGLVSFLYITCYVFYIRVLAPLSIVYKYLRILRLLHDKIESQH